MHYITAGESHGKGLVAILEGIPSGLKIDENFINSELKRRQQGYGRGGRMKIETDTIDIYAGVRGGVSLPGPIAFIIHNRDFKAWQEIMGASATKLDEKTLTKVRPGHADLAGVIKYNQKDARNILERASARETAARVAVGAICKQYLLELGITIGSHVVKIGEVSSKINVDSAIGLNEQSDLSEVRCLDKVAEKLMIENIDKAIKNKDTLGGVVQVIVSGMPVGIGSHATYFNKLDYAISGHMMGIQAVKSVEIGLGKDYANDFGSNVHDEITLDKSNITRKTNNAGGIEGGISNGENIVANITFKPIPTVMKGLQTIDILSKDSCLSAPERSDYCAIPAAGVVAEAEMAFVIANAISKTLGGDYIQEVIERMNQKRNYKL